MFTLVSFIGISSYDISSRLVPDLDMCGSCSFLMCDFDVEFHLFHCPLKMIDHINYTSVVMVVCFSVCPWNELFVCVR